MLISKADDREYQPSVFANEQEIEDLVLQADNVQRLFGVSAIGLSKRLISTLGGTSTIPDGFVVDVVQRRWFIVEAETKQHNVWQHIAPQVAKQIIAASNWQTKQLLEDAFLREKAEDIRTALQNENGDKVQCSDDSIRTRVREVLNSDPIVAIPIDGPSQDLRDFVAVLRQRVWIWHVRKWVGTNGDVYYEVPSEEEREIDTGETPETTEQRIRTVQQRSRTVEAGIAALIQNGSLVVGQKLVKVYKHKRFEASVRTDGSLECLGQVFDTPSAAAVHCIQTTGSARTTEDGWRWWCTEDGILLCNVGRTDGIGDREGNNA